MFFEGAEKKVEIMLRPGASLRPLREQWLSVVAASKATVLSTISNDRFDAYLLSESSLFVYDRAALMITCGTTSLVSAVEEMVRFIPRDDIQMLMFERKNEYFPENQLSGFDDDVARLRRLFPGQVVDLGHIGGHFVRVFYHAAADFVPPAGDMTLEILMHDLSPRARSLFSDPSLSREKLYAQSQIERIIPDHQCDDFLFKPMGYSLNAINERSYYTIHVTPEDSYSYASFETNHPFSGDIETIVERVLAIFEPRNFSLVLFKQEQPAIGTLRDYTCSDVVDSHFSGYHVRYRNFTRQ